MAASIPALVRLVLLISQATYCKIPNISFIKDCANVKAKVRSDSDFDKCKCSAKAAMRKRADVSIP